MPTETDTPVAVDCPVCASDATHAGRLLSGDSDDPFDGRLYVDGLRFFARRRAVTFENRTIVTACSACGCVWTRVNPTQLRRVLKDLQDPPVGEYAMSLMLCLGAGIAVLAWLILSNFATA